MLLNAKSVLKLGDNSKIIFDGDDCFLDAKSTSSIQFGDSASIVFRNGAYLKANGVTLSGSTYNILWNGLIFENSGADSVIDCNFNNARTAITISNDNITSGIEKIILNDSFNIPAGGSHFGIKAENCYNIIIKDNCFNMPSSSGNYIGAYLKNSLTGQILAGGGEGEGEEEIAEPVMLNIIHNTFNNGTVSLVIANYLSNFLPYFISKNTFTLPSSLNMFLMKVNGTVKNNTFHSAAGSGVHIFNSSPDFYGNSISSNNVSLNMQGYSYPNLAPLRNSNQLLWYGGKNTLVSYTQDNALLNSGGNMFTDFGHNTFSLSDTSANHIYGRIDTALHTYGTRENCWFPFQIPKISLTRLLDSIPVNVKFYNNGYDCDHVVNPNGQETVDKGGGMIDTTIVSTDNTGTTQTSEDILYSQAELYYEKEYYIDAIANFKELINNFPSEYYVQSVVYELYACYEALDTNSEQDYRNTLYGNLSVYLDEKIQTELYSEDFNYLAFDVMLMCAANIEDYDYALNGYEFISLFHPDPDIRLMASWDYAEIEALIDSGSGGGAKQLAVKQLTVNNNENTELAEQKEIKRINKIISDDPVMSKLKKSFEKTSIERKDKIEKLIKADDKNINVNSNELKSKLQKSTELDKLKNDKARRNLFELKNLTKDNLEKRRLEDILFITKDFSDESDSKVTVSIPSQYVLEQNYPNPFNPSTVIRYQLPVSNFVSLKVYDVLGKEISTLVNQKQNAGRYEIKFNASNFASGVYFYRIEAGDFVETKRMLLLK